MGEETMQVLSSFSVMVKLVLICIVIGFVIGVVTMVTVFPSAAGTRPAPSAGTSASTSPAPEP
jgi:hypothetical protein